MLPIMKVKLNYIFLGNTYIHTQVVNLKENQRNDYHNSQSQDSGYLSGKGTHRWFWGNGRKGLAMLYFFSWMLALKLFVKLCLEKNYSVLCSVYISFMVKCFENLFLTIFVIKKVI